MSVSAGSVVTEEFDGIQVFSASKFADRDVLGEKVTRWVDALRNKQGKVVSTVVSQSSDSEFHCLSITLFYQRGGRP